MLPLEIPAKGRVGERWTGVRTFSVLVGSKRLYSTKAIVVSPKRVN